jgi:tocopherol O-methyltransferase
MSNHDHRAVERYYDATWYDYRGFWMRPKDRAIHFGYWDAGVSDHSSSLLRMNEILAERAGIAIGTHVYDAGCGVGGSAFWLAEHLGATVVGVNIVPDQVDRARRYATDRDLQEFTQFRQADYAQTGLPSGTFDVAWVLESLCHAEDKRAVLEECFRLLVPGGVVVIAEYLRVGHGLPVASEALLREWLSGWAIPDLATEAEISAWLRSVGFGDVSADDITEQVRPSVRRLNRLCLLMTPVMTPLGMALTHLRAPGRLWKPLRVTPERLANVKASRAQWKAMRHDLWFYSVITARKARGVA